MKKSQTESLVRVTVPFEVKAVGEDTPNTFRGHAATWGLDLGQDIIHKGAFKNTIKEWKSDRSFVIPLLNSHNHFDIFSALGQAFKMEEDGTGLMTSFEVLEEEAPRVMPRLRPMALSKRALIGKMSIGFIPTKFSFEQPEGTDSFFDRIRHITEADLKEVSLVLFPMNPGAQVDVTSVKHFMMATKGIDPRTLKPELRYALRQLNGRIGNLLRKHRGEDEPPVPDTDLSDDDQPSPKPAEPTPNPAPTAPPSDPAPTPTPPAPSPTEEEEPKSYEFQDALKHRLTKTLLARRVSAVTSDK